MKGEILEGVQCDVCGAYEFECRDEEFYCVSCENGMKKAIYEQRKRDLSTK